jgi:site-specific recombinase XerD
LSHPKNTYLPDRIIRRNAEAFIESLRHKRPETRGTYQRALRQFVGWCTNGHRFHFRPEEVERYKRYLADKRHLSAVSVGTYLTALRRFCDFLVETAVLNDNPAKHVGGAKRPDAHSLGVLTYGDVNRLIDSIDESTSRGARDLAIVTLMLRCGLSEIEMIRANIGDLKTRDGKSVIFVQGKGHDKKDEMVSIPDDVRETIDHYLATRNGTSGDQPLFLSAGNKIKGKRMTTRGMSERVNYYLKLAGIKRVKGRRITPYSLRHTAAVMMVDAGATAEEVRQRMRLGSVATAMIYVRERDR